MQGSQRCALIVLLVALPPLLQCTLHLARRPPHTSSPRESPCRCASKVARFPHTCLPRHPPCRRSTQPLEERELTTSKEDECLGLINELKKHFQ